MSLRWRMRHVAIGVVQPIPGPMKMTVSPISEPGRGHASVGFLISSCHIPPLLPAPVVGVKSSQLHSLIAPGGATGLAEAPSHSGTQPTDEQGDGHDHGEGDEQLGDGVPGQIGHAEGPDAGDVREVGGGVPVLGDLAVSVARLEELEYLPASGVEDVISAEAWDPDGVSLFSLRIV
ncbi:hypothetical protein MCOR27_009549 [Pyricularia oryzae]|uniref:Uncharacterized protein n=1 Tax=Pyricularia grisea TaxID=148305 RepID=A0ABQ8NEA2_PYRGI|nr:hypothetical protein MCOR01_002755 [Pyricularia oryzae]KAI6295650.1 hypothetical protein MCOR33_007508 [Pyricularia grisea]KAH9432983.1 hypothetical protein MCOR02_007655 [Pyricularia oryzae]KAI6259514.1 hypothetical protein MCOR19_004155 [Pyricularia oryzae]KAI6269857.1 hypothetical protein MCOR27_009549 [Pyricularia oryzae]